MSQLTSNILKDAGYALTHQQSSLIRASEMGSVRSFWLKVGNVGEQEVHRRLSSLMENQQALRTDFGVPAGFNTLRQQVQAPRLLWQTTQASINEVQTRETKTNEARQVFEENQPHLLAWFFDGVSAERENSVLLMGSDLALDEGTVVSIREVLIGIRAADTEPEMQYLDYASWIDDLQEDEDADEAISFWKSFQWNELPPIELSEKRNERLSSLVVPERVSVPFSLLQQTALIEAAERWEVEPQLIALAVWADLLQRASGREKFQISRYHDGRDDYEELDNCIGLLQQRLPVPFYNISAASLEKAVMGLQAIYEEQVECQEYVQTISADILNSLPVSFQYLCQNSLEDIRADIYLPEGDQLQLQLVATDCVVEPDQCVGEWRLTYDSSRYSLEAMTRLVGRLPCLLEQALSQPNRPLGQLDALLGEERDLFLRETLSKSDKESDEESDRSHSTGLVERIRQHVLSTPNAPALREGSKCLTYAELGQQSDIVAVNLQNAGATPDSIVALCLPRGAELLVAILAVLKSGAAYLPLDPELPEARLQTIIEDANPDVIVVDSDDAMGFVQDESAVKRRVWKKLITEDLDNFNIDRLKTVDGVVKPDHLAYVLYTSGSTGKPKGVQVTHQNIAHYSLSAIEALQLPQAGHYGLISSLMADLGNTMLFPAWLQGGCVHLLGREESTDSAAFVRYLREYPLDCLKIVPSHLSALLICNESGIESKAESTEMSGVLPKQVLVLGGERINDTLLTQLSEYRTKSNFPKVFNHYGPTETTVGVLWQQLMLTNTDIALKGVLGDTRAYILDANLNPAISGQVAELYIAGPSVSRGYLRATDQTASRYLPDPFAAGERCYRTGDLAMRRADGGIEIVGRADQQVKIRGFRLELEEIESLLASHATVQHSAVILQNAGEQAQLVAFVVPYAGGKVEVEHLKAWLVEQLPDYMVPSQIVAVSHLPLTANGKVDSNALLEQARQQAMRRYIAPRNELEATICELWQDVLQQPEISVTDKFFDIGGHSLAAIKVVARMRQALERELPTDLLFRMQTVEALAHYLDSDLSSTDLSSGDVSIKGEANESNGLVVLREVKNAKNTLVVMHAHGNRFTHYTPLLDKLYDEVEIFGLRSDPDIATISESQQFEHLISYYINELTPLKGRDLTLAGWSLAGRQMVQLADRLIKEGFSIRSIAVIDYDPTQALENQDNELEQLRIDLSYYLTVNSINLTPEQESALDGMLSSSQNGKQSYSGVLKQLLEMPLIQSAFGEELPIESLYQSVVQRWALKKIFYRTELPILSVPIWAWGSDDNRTGYEAWSHFTEAGLTGASISSDHFSILSSQRLADQFNALLNDRDMDQEKSIQRRHSVEEPA